MSRVQQRSIAAFERAKQSIPGGVNSPARAFGGVGGTPVVMRRGDGAYLYDVDDNRYIDYIGSWGPHILGHGHPDVLQAIRTAIEDGTSFGAPTERETELAELVRAAVPSMELVRMVNSGTEATMSAIRVARGFTGRSAIVKFAGCYHGHVDSLLVSAGSGALTHGHPSSPGIPQGCTQDTLVLDYNSVEQVQQLFQARGDEIAAVILEPVVGNMGLVIPSNEFLQTLRHCCDHSGSVLIFDEVMTGFRLAYGGAQARLKVRPDMTTLGKILGGGLPVGAYGGRADILRCVSPVGPVYQAGTLSGNPVAMAAGIAMLRALQRENPYPLLEEQSRTLTEGLSRLADRHGIPHTCPQIGSMWTFFFQPQPVRNLADAMRSHVQDYGQFFHAMLDRGVYLACSQFEANFVSAKHTSAEITATLAAANDALALVAKHA
jgi:glutamate-1-semialdehyde 2,1-aminomutase